MDDAATTELQGWLARLNANDPRARDELIQRSMNRLRRLVHHSLSGFARLRRFEDTDDVLQGLLLRLLRRLESVHPPTAADFFRLAASEARKTLIDLTRHYCGPQGAVIREARIPESASDQSAGHLEGYDSTYNSDKLANWQEFHRQVELLPAEEADVFAMIWYNDLKQEEVAAALGVSVPTVKRRWLSARLRLQRWFEGQNPEQKVTKGKLRE
jgi:RNA polymerase sigma-70 factor (ECF subfamily)